MKPINTEYRGVRYRTKLEAQWAVFLDAVGVEFKYEPAAYDLGGITYIPDFWLPGLKCHLDAQETTPSDEARMKAGRMAEDCNRPTYLLIGPPEVPNGNAGQETRHHILVGGDGKSINHQWWLECPACAHVGLGRWVRGGWRCVCNTDLSGDYKSALLLVAYSRAKKFRFDAAAKETAPPFRPEPGTSPKPVAPPLAAPIAATSKPVGLVFPPIHPAGHAPPVSVPGPHTATMLTSAARAPEPVATKEQVRFDPERDIKPLRERRGGRVDNETYGELVLAVDRHAGDLQRALNDGWSVARIADKFNVPETTLTALFEKRGVKAPRHAEPELPMSLSVVTPEMMRDAMLILHRIAADLGVPCDTLERHLRILRPLNGTPQ